MADFVKGRILDWDSDPRGSVAWSFKAKKKGGRIMEGDIKRELFDTGKEGESICPSHPRAGRIPSAGIRL